MQNNETDTSHVRARHDELFKKVFGEKGNARDFLEAHLPPAVLAHLDMDTLHRLPATFIDEKLKKHYADLVYSVKTKSPACPEIRFYLLFEHKAWPDEFVGIQVIRYMSMLWTGILEDKAYNHPRLPPILPIVFYQTNDGWVPRTSFRDLIASPSEVFAGYIPDFAFDFVAADDIDPKAVQHNVVLTFYVAILQALDSPELAHLLPLLVQGLLDSLEPREALEYIIVFLTYLSKATERLKQEDLEQAITMLPQGGRDIMNTLADQWMRQGWDKGKIEGKIEGKTEGKTEGQVEGVRSTILDQILAKFDHIPLGLTGKLSAIDDLGTLKGLSVSLIKADSLETFLAHLDRATKPATH